MCVTDELRYGIHKLFKDVWGEDFQHLTIINHLPAASGETLEKYGERLAKQRAEAALRCDRDPAFEITDVPREWLKLKDCNMFLVGDKLASRVSKRHILDETQISLSVELYPPVEGFWPEGESDFDEGECQHVEGECECI